MITDLSGRQKTNHGDSETRRALKSRTRDVLSHEIGFIPSPCFREFDANKRWRRELATSDEVDTTAHSGRSNLPSHLEQMCSCPLLTHGEERDLFCRMNYLKYRANAIRSTLNENRPSIRKLEQISQYWPKPTRLEIALFTPTRDSSYRS